MLKLSILKLISNIYNQRSLTDVFKPLNIISSKVDDMTNRKLANSDLIQWENLQ